MRKSNRGFTLIELLVVIAIIGILSSVVLASLNGARLKGRDARRLSDLKQIKIALELWYDANGSEYPDSLNALTSPTAYIASVPTDPNGGSNAGAYWYANLTSTNGGCSTASGVCGSYVLGATMEGAVPQGSVTSTIGPVGDNVNCSGTGVYCTRP